MAIDGADEKHGYGVGIFTGQGCIRVAPGIEMKAQDPMRAIEDGFVSTWTGEVYDSMLACWVGGKALRETARLAE